MGKPSRSKDLLSLSESLSEYIAQLKVDVGN